MRRAVAPLAVSFALALVPAARADDAAALYDPGAVARIDLTLAPEALAALTADPSTYVPATFAMQLGDETFGPAPPSSSSRATAPSGARGGASASASRACCACRPARAAAGAWPCASTWAARCWRCARCSCVATAGTPRASGCRGGAR
jgi:hypothetical protein